MHFLHDIFTKSLGWTNDLDEKPIKSNGKLICVSSVLDELVSKGDMAGFDEFKHRVANRGHMPQQAQPNYSGGGSGATYRPATMAPGRSAMTGGAAARCKYLTRKLTE